MESKPLKRITHVEVLAEVGLEEKGEFIIPPQCFTLLTTWLKQEGIQYAGDVTELLKWMKVNHFQSYLTTAGRLQPEVWHKKVEEEFKAALLEQRPFQHEAFKATDAEEASLIELGNGLKVWPWQALDKVFLAHVKEAFPGNSMACTKK